ncbi:MAG TPA: toll/interleukin-1 receptor domain-containing protein, partial [Steroidobacteraceae bacterium]|nr:toll/interleukin-1 receptor domain-containing protein [Steroidobacteraceae bacterium]
MSVVPSVFISYSHADADVAQRLRQRLSAHGVDAWLDTRNLRVGSTLDSSLRQHIEAAHVVVAIASQKSADSKWCGLEIECAIGLEKPVIPLFVEPVKAHARFTNHKGFDVPTPRDFAGVADELIRDLFAALEQPVPDADRALLEKELRQLATRQTVLA